MLLFKVNNLRMKYKQNLLMGAIMMYSVFSLDDRTLVKDRTIVPLLRRIETVGP